MKNFKGVIIEESLVNTSVLKDVKVVSTDVEEVTEEHKTPWIKRWTMHNVEIDADKADNVALQLSKLLDTEHNWYADFKNNTTHYVIFTNKVFKINRSKKEEYEEATQYGISIGIPDYQVDFSDSIKQWKR